MPIGASKHRWIKLTPHRVADDAVFEAIGQITRPKRGVMQELEIGQPKDWLTVLIRQLLKFPDDPLEAACAAKPMLGLPPTATAEPVLMIAPPPRAMRCGQA